MKVTLPKLKNQLLAMKGRSAAHTGKQNGNWAGSHQGPNYTVQANIMAARTFDQLLNA